jgi:RNA polymerase sigma factor (sigma-70 family)
MPHAQPVAGGTAALLDRDLAPVDQDPAAQGSVPDVFEAFFERTVDRVYRAVFAAAQDRELAADATAEAFARAYKHWDDLADHPNTLGWVVRTALNYQTSWRRRLARETASPPPEQPTQGSGPLLRLVLFNALRELPKRQVQVVVLRYIGGMDMGEIADALGISQRTVAVHHYRAMHALRVALAEEEP